MLLGIPAVLSFTPTLVNPSVLYMWDPWILSRGDSWFVCQYVSILIYVFAKRALELKCCALLVQLVKVFGNLCWSLCFLSSYLVYSLDYAGETKEKDKTCCFPLMWPLKQQSVDSLCFWLRLSLSLRATISRLHWLHLCVHCYANSFKRLRGLSCRQHALNFTLRESGSVVCTGFESPADSSES